MRTLPVALCMTLSLLALSGCGDSGTYELSWTIDCPGGGDCPPRTVKECTRYGIDSIEVLASAGGAGEPTRTLLACFSPGEGPIGRGPGLSPGPTSLSVYGLSPSGIRITPAVKASAEIPDTGVVQVSVDLPRPIQCGDGVDNDADGLVDLLDPECADLKDDDESS